MGTDTLVLPMVAGRSGKLISISLDTSELPTLMSLFESGDLSTSAGFGQIKSLRGDLDVAPRIEWSVVTRFGLVTTDTDWSVTCSTSRHT